MPYQPNEGFMKEARPTGGCNGPAGRLGSRGGPLASAGCVDDQKAEGAMVGQVFKVLVGFHSHG